MNTNVFYNMDCLEFMKSLPDKCIDLVLTDIPYNEVNRVSNGLRNLDKGKADNSAFDMGETLHEINRIARGCIYIFCGTEQVSGIRKYFVSQSLSTRHCIWEKKNPSPMNGEHIWLSSIENCIFAKNKGAVFNEFCKSAVWRFAIETNQIHPTQKPLRLFEYLIKVSSEEGQTILDCFSGSGTTAIACHNLNRQFICIEKDKEYFDKSVERYNKHILQERIFND